MGSYTKKKYDIDLIGFTDSDWEGDNIDRKSTSRYVFILAEGPIIWSSKNQSAIALSSIEAQYRGVVTATTQCLWFQGILGECGFESEFSTIIYCDSQRTIQIYSDLVYRHQTKHIEIHMHYIRQLVHDGTIDLLFCASTEQVANIFTKDFCEKKLSNIKSLLGITDHAMKHD